MKKALVTGGNRGIGLAVVNLLALKGYKVFLGTRDSKKGAKEAKKLQGEGFDVESICLDIADSKSVKNAEKSIHTRFGALDVLVNNAGILKDGDIFSTSEKALVDSFNTNTLGPTYCIRAFAPQMIKENYGRIVNVSSSWGSFDMGLEGPFSYAISKAALNAVTLTCSKELPKSVKINSICPGWVRTSMGGRHASVLPEEAAEMIVKLATLPKSGPTGKFFQGYERAAW